MRKRMKQFASIIDIKLDSTALWTIETVRKWDGSRKIFAAFTGRKKNLEGKVVSIVGNSFMTGEDVLLMDVRNPREAVFRLKDLGNMYRSGSSSELVIRAGRYEYLLKKYNPAGQEYHVLERHTLVKCEDTNGPCFSGLLTTEFRVVPELFCQGQQVSLINNDGTKILTAPVKEVTTKMARICACEMPCIIIETSEKKFYFSEESC